MVDASSILLFLAALLAMVGFACLAVAMEVHWKQVNNSGGPTPTVRVLLRLVGALALYISLNLCLKADHPTMAVLVWVMLLAVAAIANALILTWYPQWLNLHWFHVYLAKNKRKFFRT